MEAILVEAKKRACDLRKGILTWSVDNLRIFPWRTNRNPYRILVAEILLKRTTASAVLRIFDEFISKYPDINYLSSANKTELESFLKTIGYYKIRTHILIDTAGYVLRHFEGKLPKNRKKLESIPNIGPYTACAILSLGYGLSYPMVDSNIERIFKRLFNNQLPPKSLKKSFLSVGEIVVPPTDHEIFNLAFLDLGALICTYRGMNCQICPIRNCCDTHMINSH